MIPLISGIIEEVRMRYSGENFLAIDVIEVIYNGFFGYVGRLVSDRKKC